MTDPRLNRIAALATRLDQLTPLEPLAVRLARRALASAQADLHSYLLSGQSETIVEAARYRVQRAHDLLEQQWHDAAVAAV